jgi:uncharacterized membrane protein YfcA
MSIGHAVFLFVACVLAGAVNSVAGGGTLLSFPAAIAAGLPPITANATNAVAMMPGSLAAAWTYRRKLAGLGWLTALLCAPAIAGALIGARILRHTPQRLFDQVVPWLVLGATLIILFQAALPRGPRNAEAAKATETLPTWRPRALILLVGLQLLVAIYGGYFGAAMGIIMLAFLAYLPKIGSHLAVDIHQMNAIKNVLAVVINGAASVDFIIHGLVRPAAGLLMAVGAIVGGIVGGRLGRRAQPRQIRWIVVAIGFAMTALLAWRHYG